MKTIHVSLLILLVSLCLFTAPVSATDTASGSYPEEWANTYTPEELAAIESAMWAANMRISDLTYRKDYSEGYGCFPVVRNMMHDPLSIAPYMDLISLMGASEPDLFRLPKIYSVLYFSAVSIDLDSDETLGDGGIGLSYFRNNFLFSDEKFETDYLPETFNSFEHLVSSLRDIAGVDPNLGIDEHKLALYRHYLPEHLAWHDVFEKPESATEMLDSDELGPEASSQMFEELSSIDFELLDSTSMNTWASIYPGYWLSLLPLSAFPQDQPYIEETNNGRIAIGTPGDDYYEGDFVVLVDPGGNDTYHNCRIGAAYGAPSPELGNGRIGYFVDLHGDDFYDCADVNFTLGAAIMGQAAFYDLGGGDDRYYAGSCSLGAAMAGVATFYDDGGSDFYSGKVFTQGAAGFGIGIMIDDSVGDAPVFDTAEGNDADIDNHEVDPEAPNVHNQMDNDYYTAWANSQAFARPRGIAVCMNKRGNETYHAGGVYLHAPLFSDRYQSFSQGFSIGDRGTDWAGGIAMLIDYDGNDRYLGDIYNQGVGYWYGAGLLWDGGGNDTYEMTQYGQGSGIHLAIGGLVDVAGSDTYIMHSGLGQGSSHDMAASVLHDRGGNDRYHGNTTCNGGALAGACALFIDRSGDDTYAGRGANSVNYSDGRSINAGVFVDLAGDDTYILDEMDDGAQWCMQNISMGIDIAPPPVEDTETATAPTEPDGPPEGLVVPEVCSYEGELTQEVFDELWEIACRWTVGDNQYITPKARDRIVAFGPDALPYISAKMDSDDSGLALRAFIDVLGKLRKEHDDEVNEILRENIIDEDPTRIKIALYLIGELKVGALGNEVADCLHLDDESLQRRAIGVLGSLESHVADELLLGLIPGADEAMLRTILTTLTNLEVDCYAELRPLLSHELFTIREQLEKQLAAHWEFYRLDVINDLIDPATPVRAQRTLLGSVTRANEIPDELTISGISFLIRHDDWGVRADTVRMVRHWQELAGDSLADIELIQDVVSEVDWMLTEETEPYVLFAGEK